MEYLGKVKESYKYDNIIILLLKGFLKMYNMMDFLLILSRESNLGTYISNGVAIFFCI